MHQLGDLLRQRVYGIACGYPDCNDDDRLAHDPIQKLQLAEIPSTVTLTMPGYDCLRLNKDESRAPTWPETREQNPEEAV
jgi:hypothetical protein